ncbi:hypothetical protein AC622_15305 [Bacillus sp. FJAT-27916]|uniref:TVP38/TMEM64 family protein n=1 Tax=Bacillaceae TaxID=186817 RepID=UPI0006714D73|nr:TVP38/TMEM64 family protein [Bacillus sp. FJAT-27916]KMY45422.1 hypothetical protein AC622_15305 [Bacillus sp. FJAT-27916]
MDLSWLTEWLTMERLAELISDYRNLGPIPGLLLPFLEAFLPFLPLFVFVTANANAFGLWIGFLLSWTGAVAGAMVVFYLARMYGRKRTTSFVHRHPAVQKAMSWIDRHGFGPLFILLCFPFTPSAIVNIVSGLSDISPKQYMIAVFGGKMVMIFTISYIGHDIMSLIREPIKSVIMGVIIFILWIVGKQVEIRLNKTGQKEHS